MIWIALYLLLFGGGDASLARPFEQARAQLPAVVVEPARLARAQAIVAQVDEALAAHRAQRESSFTAWGELAKKRAATADELRARIAAAAAANADLDARLVDLRFALREALTREEWRRLFPAPK